eukprot:6456343-Amphidinium_carterae.1
MTWDLHREAGIDFEVRADRVVARIPSEFWAEASCRPSSLSSALPTFVRPIPREAPPLDPSGEYRLDHAAWLRWEADCFNYPPYHYCAEAMMLDPNGDLRLPTINEKELLLGYPLDHTYSVGARQQRQDTRWHAEERHRLMGRAPHVGVLMWVLGPPLHDHGVLLCAASTEEVAESFGWSPNAIHDDVSDVALVNFFLSRTSRKGQDIKLNLWRQGSRPQTSHALSPRWWTWQVDFSAPWKHHDEHINALELRALLLAIKFL